MSDCCPQFGQSLVDGRNPITSAVMAPRACISRRLDSGARARARAGRGPGPGQGEGQGQGQGQGRVLNPDTLMREVTVLLIFCPVSHMLNAHTLPPPTFKFLQKYSHA